MRAGSVLLVLAAGVTLMPGQSSTPAWRFEPIQPDLFATGTTLVNAAADYDGDGDVDIFVGFNGTPNRLYRNDRGVFQDVAAAAGIADARATRAAAWGDVDADGDPDLLVGFAPFDSARGGAASVAQDRSFDSAGAGHRHGGDPADENERRHAKATTTHRIALSVFSRSITTRWPSMR